MNVKSYRKYVFGAMIALPLSLMAPLMAQIPGSTNAAGMPLSDTAAKAVSQTSPGRANVGSTMADSSLNGSVNSDISLAKDKMFVRHAEEGGLAMVQMGQMATLKASNDDVKKFGQTMIDDHTKLNSDLAPIADSLGVEPPTKLNKADQDEYNKLNGLSGSDFDKEYLSFMLKDHRKDLHDFRVIDKTTPDPDLKDTVDNGIKVIALHLYLVNKLAVANGVPGAYKPAVPPPPPPPAPQQ
jgi:putative membrane protein